MISKTPNTPAAPRTAPKIPHPAALESDNSSTKKAQPAIPAAVPVSIRKTEAVLLFQIPCSATSEARLRYSLLGDHAAGD